MKNNYAKTPTIYQMEATECGAASLAMILGYYGKYVPLEQMRIETGVSRDGCNAKNILRGARKLGLDAKGYRKSLDKLMEVKPPCIIHWNFNHFVVYEGYKGDKFYINDPAVAEAELTEKKLMQLLQELCLSLKKTKFSGTKKESSLTTFVKKGLLYWYFL